MRLFNFVVIVDLNHSEDVPCINICKGIHLWGNGESHIYR